jgi:hypothetical protein
LAVRRDACVAVNHILRPFENPKNRVMAMAD